MASNELRISRGQHIQNSSFILFHDGIISLAGPPRYRMGDSEYPDGRIFHIRLVVGGKSLPEFFADHDRGKTCSSYMGIAGSVVTSDASLKFNE